MANELLPSAKKVSFSAPSETKYEGIFLRPRGAALDNPQFPAAKMQYEPISRDTIVVTKSGVAVDNIRDSVSFDTAHGFTFSGSSVPIHPMCELHYFSTLELSGSSLERTPYQALSPECQEQCKDAICNLLVTAGKSNWDDDGGDPVTEEIVEIALKIVGELPGNVAPPDISADPEGNIDFDWHLDNGTMFTISVGQIGDIAISGLRPGKSKFTGMVKDYEGKSFSLLQCGLEWLTEMQESR